MKLEVIEVKTRKVLPPKDDLYEILDQHLPKLKEGDVLLIASKILAIHQGRSVKIGKLKKADLVKLEADFHLPGRLVAGSEIIITIKDHTLIPSAGIDESNGKGHYILWPKNTNQLLKKICQYLKKKFHIKKLAVVATDSHTTPLRWGTQGIAIGFYGIKPLFDYRGKKDIFGRKLKYTQRNLVDPLANLGALIMGEGNEQTPMAIVRGAKWVKFTTKDYSKEFFINPKDDLYYPLLKIFKKR